MADTAISGLTDGSTVQTTDQLAVNRSGSNFRVVVGALATKTTTATVDYDDDSVTLAKLATGTANRLFGTEGAGDPVEISVAGDAALAGSVLTVTTEVSTDTTPVLGGDLTMSGNALVTTANADVLLSPNGSGAVSVSEVTDYENNVTADDDIPNKKFCDDTFSAITRTVNAQTGTTYTLVIGDAGDIVTMSNASAQTLTIPTNASVAFAIGAQIDVSQIGAGVTSVAGDTGVTLNGVSAGTGALSAQYGSVTLVKLATDTWLMTGNHDAVA
ncbi:MAG: hypothetical protein ACR2P3_06670 [Geminicoccaceae bacterium]